MFSNCHVFVDLELGRYRRAFPQYERGNGFRGGILAPGGESTRVRLKLPEKTERGSLLFLAFHPPSLCTVVLGFVDC